MRVLDAGHKFALRHLDGPGEEVLQFVKREGKGYPGNVGHYEGTTMQEVLRALISRAKYVDGQIPCYETDKSIELMRGALRWFEVRAARRHGRVFECNEPIETADTCEKCGHIGCNGECRAWLKRQDVPHIVCLCGSTRFYQQFQRANYDETMAGNIVLTVGFYPHAAQEAHSEQLGCTEGQKIRLDELHKRKIDLADEVFVLNVGGYIGSSTRSEIEYAEKIGRPIRYLEADRGKS